MNDDKKKGLGAARDLLPIMLEDKIRDALLSLPKKELEERYATAADQTRVFRRSILRSIHDVIFNEFNDSTHVRSEGIDVIIPSHTNKWYAISKEFSAARRDFAHDTELLNNGKKADLILAPVDREPISKNEDITNNQKLLMMSLLIIRSRGSNIKEKDRLNDVSKATGIPIGTLRTETRNLTKELNKIVLDTKKTANFTQSKLKYYYDLESMAENILGPQATPKAIGDLYFPALCVLAQANPYSSKKR